MCDEVLPPQVRRNKVGALVWAAGQKKGGQFVSAADFQKLRGEPAAKNAASESVTVPKPRRFTVGKDGAVQKEEAQEEDEKKEEATAAPKSIVGVGAEETPVEKPAVSPTASSPAASGTEAPKPAKVPSFLRPSGGGGNNPPPQGPAPVGTGSGGAARSRRRMLEVVFSAAFIIGLVALSFFLSWLLGSYDKDKTLAQGVTVPLTRQEAPSLTPSPPPHAEQQGKVVPHPRPKPAPPPHAGKTEKKEQPSPLASPAAGWKDVGASGSCRVVARTADVEGRPGTLRAQQCGERVTVFPATACPSFPGWGTTFRRSVSFTEEGKEIRGRACFLGPRGNDTWLLVGD
ncbi:MAG: hypothetical protein HYS74_00835 [Parcubacteria group bacterium]|nr:hypothetical protein [Parcubacteria group bacterium]